MQKNYWLGNCWHRHSYNIRMVTEKSNNLLKLELLGKWRSGNSSASSDEHLEVIPTENVILASFWHWAGDWWEAAYAAYPSSN